MSLELGVSKWLDPDGLFDVSMQHMQRDLALHSSTRSRRRISRDSSVLGRSRKQSGVSMDSRRSIDAESSAAIDDQSLHSGAASSRRIGSRRAVRKSGEEESRGMLGSLIASFRRESVDYGPSGRRPSLGRNRSSQSIVSRGSSRGARSDQGEEEQEDENSLSETGE